MIKPVSLYQGDSSSIITVRPDVIDPSLPLDSDWVCKESLIGADGTEYVAPRIITEKTADGTHWVLGLSPEDTEKVTVTGKFTSCFWVIEVSNDVLTIPYRRELHKPVNVKKQGIS